MKNLLLFVVVFLTGFAVLAQNHLVRQNIKSEKALTGQIVGFDGLNNNVVGESTKTNPAPVFKSTDVVSVVSIGTAANAYGQANSGRANLNLNNDLNTVTNFHRMGGELDPGGYSGDLGYDISTDGGMTWTNQVEVWVAQENAGGEYFLDAARYPQHGLFNPAGNTDPNNAYVAFLCPTIGATNGTTWGGYAIGRANVGDITDTTRHFVQSPGNGIFYYVPDGFSLNNLGEFWVTDVNTDWTSGTGVYLDALMISHGVWDEAEDDFVTDIFPFECETVAAASPANTGVEFSPDGQIGYIVALADIGEVEISEGFSYYPVLWRTEDAGETWSDPIPVALAGEDGIAEVQNYLSDEEIAELFLEPLPDRDEIPFTTAFDCDLSVDAWGNPHIAVVVGVTSAGYDILTGISPSSGYAFTSCFLLSSDDMGNEGSWVGHQVGRPVSFRGNFGELAEDNRIQISRDQLGYKMFVAWIDTDTTVSAENNAPDIWARGMDVESGELTPEMPVNVTFGSEATFSAYFFNLANEVMDDDNWNFTLPMVYLNMTPPDPYEPVQFKYIKDFAFSSYDFEFPAYLTVGIEDTFTVENSISVSGVSPNPASGQSALNINCSNPLSATIQITNLMGQNVKTLQRNLNAGNNEITLDVSKLKSGIYFITIEAGGQTLTKKLMVE